MLLSPWRSSGIKSNENTRTLMQKVYDDVLQTGDDQVSFNRVIERNGIKWEIRDMYDMFYMGKGFICSKQIISGSSSGYTISLLPHSFFQRVNEFQEPVFLKHLIFSIL